MKKKKVSLIEAIITLIIMLTILSVLIIRFQLAPHVPILFVLMLLIFYGKLRGFTWDEIHDGIIKGVTPGIIPIIIFLFIGVLVGTWMQSGTIPTIMYYGFKVVSIKFFIPMVFLVCAIVGITVGSSFTTISTIGIAFLGIGNILGFSNMIVSGAIVSGAFLGNNLSPLSDTTNLSSGLAKVNLYVHIKNMFKTSIPAALIALVIYTALGFKQNVQSMNNINSMSSILYHSFDVSFLSILPIIFLFTLAVFKIPAIPSLLSSSLVAVLISAFRNISKFNLKNVANIIMNGYVAHTGNVQMDKLLSRGGISSMLGSAALIILALALGGILIKLEIISTIIDSLKNTVNTPGKLILYCALSSIGVNFIVGEQYLSIILPGETFKHIFDELHLDRKYLSRTLSSAGATVNSIVPWGVSGIFISGVLNINPVSFVPFSIYSYMEPIMSILLGFLVLNKIKTNKS